MIAFLLTNWKTVVPLLAAATFAVLLGLRTIQYDALKVTVANERAAAQAAALKATAEAKAKDDKNAELARDLEAAHTKADQDLDATRADFADRLRVAAGTACHSSLPRAAPGPGKPQAVTAGGDGGRGSNDIAGFVAVRDLALKLQADLKLCVSWANGVGR